MSGQPSADIPMGNSELGTLRSFCKPCPFCGDIDVEVRGYHEHGTMAVFCYKCHASGPMSVSDVIAIESWNFVTRRVPIPAEPKFMIGDSVTWERSKHGTPRWNYDQDSGGTGKNAVGKVVDVVGSEIHVRMEGGLLWKWPVSGHARHSPFQWQRRGFLRHVACA